jgi:hypothetical protein
MKKKVRYAMGLAGAAPILGMMVPAAAQAQVQSPAASQGKTTSLQFTRPSSTGQIGQLINHDHGFCLAASKPKDGKAGDRVWLSKCNQNDINQYWRQPPTHLNALVNQAHGLCLTWEPTVKVRQDELQLRGCKWTAYQSWPNSGNFRWTVRAKLGAVLAASRKQTTINHDPVWLSGFNAGLTNQEWSYTGG